MSHNTLTKTNADNQHSIKFYTLSNSGIHERTKQLIADRINQEKGKPASNSQERGKQFITPSYQTTPKSKRKTPPSLEKGEADEVTKRLHFSEPSPPTIMNPNKENDQKTTSKEDLILSRLDGIQESMDRLQLEWKQHTNELLSVKHENIILNQKMKKLERSNSELNDRVKKLEDQLLEANVVFQGVPESAWESEKICREKIINIIVVLVNKPTTAEHIDGARMIPIKLEDSVGTTH